MGCDIHMVLETRHKNKWIGVNCYEGQSTLSLIVRPKNWDSPKPELDQYISWRIRQRNYELFAALAGVRGEGPEPRGLPADISDLALREVDSWGSDGHSHSWGRLSEIGPIFAAFYMPEALISKDRHEAIADLFGVSLWGDPSTSPDGPLSNYRLIYWFDN